MNNNLQRQCTGPVYDDIVDSIATSKYKVPDCQEEIKDLNKKFCSILFFVIIVFFTFAFFLAGVAAIAMFLLHQVEIYLTSGNGINSQQLQNGNQQMANSSCDDNQMPNSSCDGNQLHVSRVEETLASINFTLFNNNNGLVKEITRLIL